MIKYLDKSSGIFSKLEWDAGKDYGNEYAKVYFRIDTPTYDGATGFIDVKSRDEWNIQASKVIKSLGIMEDCGYTVEHSKDKRAYLYAHPQDISGVVRKNDIKRVAETIDNMQLSSIRWVDIYETVYVISDSEYNDYLISQQSKIRKLLFDLSATPRTTTFYSLWEIAGDIASRVKLQRLGIADKHNGATADFVKAEAKKMVDEGYLKLVTNEQGEYIRSLNKTEQKKYKLYI